MRERDVKGTEGWPALFLPGDAAIDGIAKKYLSEDVRRAATLLSVSPGAMSLVVEEHKGRDHHDWLRHVAASLVLSQDFIYRSLIQKWLEDEAYRSLAEDLMSSIESVWEPNFRNR